MEVFISFSRDHSQTAEKIAVKLRTLGLQVFYDRDSLEAGKGFDEAIRKALDTCDLFIFLISPGSTAKGAYALTELRHIQERWPCGEGRVLPVMVADTSDDKIPAYILEGLTIFMPDGDCAAEVANQVRKTYEEFTNAKSVREKRNPVASRMDALIDAISKRRKLAPDDPEKNVYSRNIDKLVKEIKERFTPKEGMTVAGAILEKVVGSGNFGTVWKATDIETKEKVAVKIFRLERLTEGQMLARFSRSVRAMRILSEEKRKSRASYTRGQIVRFYRADETGLAFAMDYIGGGNLEDVERLGWNLDRKLDVAISVCEAVAYAHANGVIHRDIKPANIVLSAKQNPVLTDFDISDIKWATSLSTTIEGGLGTPVFAAPEQLINADDADELADIYSIGRLLYYLLLERSPGYELEKDPELRNIRNQPPGLVAIVRKATQYDRTKRFKSVDELLKALEKCRTGTAAIQARALNFQRSMKRNWHVGIILTLIVGVSSGFAIYQTDVARKQARAARSEKLAREDAVRAKEALTLTNEQLQSTNVKLLEAEAAVSELMEEQKKYTQSEKDLEVLREQLRKTPEGTEAYKELSSNLEALQQRLESQKGWIDQLSDKAQKLQDEARKTRVAKSDIRKPDTQKKRKLRCDGDDCTRAGLCKVETGKCVATPKSCLEADVCKEQAQCVADKGVCVATTESCMNSSLCSDEALCVAVKGRCVATDQTCKNSELCSLKERCRAFAGTCVSTEMLRDDPEKLVKSDSTATVTAMGNAMWEEGLWLYDTGRYQSASSIFRKVYEMEGDQRALLFYATCEYALERYGIALDALESVIHNEQKEKGGDRKVQILAFELQKKILGMTGSINIWAPSKTVIEIDGKKHGEAPLGPIRVKADIDHTISWSLKGKKIMTRSFRVGVGETIRFDIFPSAKGPRGQGAKGPRGQGAKGLRERTEKKEELK